jgi:hypothetical protein
MAPSGNLLCNALAASAIVEYIHDNAVDKYPRWRNGWFGR